MVVAPRCHCNEEAVFCDVVQGPTSRRLYCCAKPWEQKCGFFQPAPAASADANASPAHSPKVPDASIGSTNLKEKVAKPTEGALPLPQLALDSVRKQAAEQSKLALAEALVNAGAVVNVRVAGSGFVSAQVQGSGGIIYEVEVPPLSSLTRPTAKCGCADYLRREELCKHGAAVLLALALDSDSATKCVRRERSRSRSPVALAGRLRASSQRGFGRGEGASFASERERPAVASDRPLPCVLSDLAHISGHGAALEEFAYAGYAMMSALKTKFGRVPYGSQLGPSGTVRPDGLCCFEQDAAGAWSPRQHVRLAVFTRQVLKSHERRREPLLGVDVLDRKRWLEDHGPMVYDTAFLLESSHVGEFYIYYPSSHRGVPPPNLHKYGLDDAPPGAGPGCNCTSPSYQYGNYSSPYESSGKYRVDKNMVTLLGETYAHYVSAYAKAYKNELCGGHNSLKAYREATGLSVPPPAAGGKKRKWGTTQVATLRRARRCSAGPQTRRRRKQRAPSSWESTGDSEQTSRQSESDGEEMVGSAAEHFDQKPSSLGMRANGCATSLDASAAPNALACAEEFHGLAAEAVSKQADSEAMAKGKTERKFTSVALGNRHTDVVSSLTTEAMNIDTIRLASKEQIACTGVDDVVRTPSRSLSMVAGLVKDTPLKADAPRGQGWAPTMCDGEVLRADTRTRESVAEDAVSRESLCPPSFLGLLGSLDSQSD